MQIQKTVFISYRRTNSFHALAVYQHLSALGYDVFYDVDSLRGGDWLQSIIENIKARAHFLIILTPSAVDRFNEPGDVMRQEIETAIDTQRNIIPLMMDSFDFRQNQKYLTGKLGVLSSYNGLEIPARFFKYAMQELHEQRLQQDITTIIHPVSSKAKVIIKEQQRNLQVEPDVTEGQLSAEEYFERGLSRDKDDCDGKIADYTEAIRLNPNYTDAYINRGIAYKAQGELDRAITDYSKAIRLNPQYATAYYNRGIARNSKSDVDGAIADYNVALRLDPYSVMAYNNRGIARSDKGNLEGAIADYTEAIRLKPQEALAYNNRGIARSAKSDFESAIADYNVAIRLNPQDASIYNNRGEAFFVLKLFSKALSDFKQANELRPAYNMTLAGIAITHHALGEFQQAKAIWQLLLKLDDRYRDADWVGKEHNWRPELIEEARNLIAKL